jgi:hypothetical protein
VPSENLGRECGGERLEGKFLGVDQLADEEEDESEGTVDGVAVEMHFENG